MEEVREYELRMQRDTNSRVLNNMDSLEEQEKPPESVEAAAAEATAS